MRKYRSGPALLALCVALGATGCHKKDDNSSQTSSKAGPTASAKTAEVAKDKTAPLVLVKTALPTLKLTMQAPKGAKITATGGQVSVAKGDAFRMNIQKDIYGATGDALIIPFEKKLVKKKLVDKPDLQIWTKDMVGQTAVLFAMVVKAGKQKYYIQSDGLEVFTRPEIDTMVKAAKTLAPQ